MKHFLHFNGAQYRFIAILLLVVFGISTATALESDDINTAILVEGSLPPTWTNDAAHPWRIPDGANYIQTPESKDDSNFTSTLSFTYTSSYPTEITFSAWRYYYYSGQDYLAIKIDGEEKAHNYYYNWESFRFLLPVGSHTVEFVSVSTRANYDDERYNSAIRDLKVLECRELETACLKEGSLPITFENDPDNMWITGTGYIRSTTNYIDGEASSKISTTFTIDKASLFSFEIRDYRGYSDYYNTKVYIDGVLRNTFASENWQYSSVVLYPGTHTIEFENWQGSRSSNYITEIRNVRLDQTWYEATLNNPGELGVRMLQALGDKNLQDAELVKINGAMNADDWATVKQLTGATAIDFTGTNITEIPNEGMRGLSHLSTVMLPETLTKIGDNAFRGTDFYQINIPASVERIGVSAWYQTPLQFISFEQDSKLSYIDYQTFYQTKLIEFIMPDSVTEIGRYSDSWSEDSYDQSNLFYECGSLKKLHLSDNLTSVPALIAYNCHSLEEVNIPSKATIIERSAFAGANNIRNIEIPETVTKIGKYAFSYTAIETLNIPASVITFGECFANECRSLKEVRLSSHCWNMDSYFRNCTALETVVLPCATPPSISEDPFYGVNKASVKLLVPDFAYAAYKADAYWYNFRAAEVSDEASVNDYWAIRGSLTLDESHVMRGTPSVEMITGGSLVMDSLAVQSFDTFTYKTRESAPASFLSRSNKVTANKLETRFYVASSNTWYFFSPVTDVKMSDITFPASDSWVIRYYDGARRASENATSGNWINVPADGTLHRGEGYIIQARAAGWLYMPAATTEHDKFFGSNEVTLPLADNTCETPEHAGWNFVANPYPSFYDIYYIAMQAPITVWTGSTYRAYSLNDGDRGDDTFVLRPMQPFFVQKDNADLTTTMPLVGRQINTTIDRTRAPQRASVDPNRHKLNLELFRDGSDEAEDYTRIVLNEEAQMAYETKCDASKFMSMDASVAQLYSFGGNNHPMAINERPYDDGNVALGVYLPEVGKTYRISALRADRRAWIYDAVTGIEHDLTMGDYYFTAAKAGTDNKRFTIRFAPGSSTVGSLDATPVKVTGNTGYIAVSAPAGAKVAVYATDGTMIANLKAESGTAEIPAAAGIYIVKVNDETVKTIVK